MKKKKFHTVIYNFWSQLLMTMKHTEEMLDKNFEEPKNNEDNGAVFLNRNSFNIAVKYLIKKCISEILKEETMCLWFMDRTNSNQTDEGDATTARGIDVDGVFVILLEENKWESMLSFLKSAKNEAFRQIKNKRDEKLAFKAEMGQENVLSVLQRPTSAEGDAYCCEKMLSRKLNEVTHTLMKNLILLLKS